MAEINEQYVRGYLIGKGYEDLPKENIINVLDAMKKYGENRWWESDDSITLAYHQLYEDIMIIKLARLYEGASKICGRLIMSHDLWMDRENLLKEVEEGMKRLKRNIGVSEEGCEALVEASVKRLEDLLKKEGKSIIYLDGTK